MRSLLTVVIWSLLLASLTYADDSQIPRGLSSCCLGEIRGNVDYDSYDLVDLVDVVTLVDWMFRGGPEPPCLREANVDGSCCADPPGESAADINISDLVYLVEYLFADGPPPAPSPTPERWERTYGGLDSDVGISVERADDGGYVAVGNTGSFGSGGSDIYVVRTDPWGDTVWTRTFGGPYYDDAYDVVASGDGGFVIAGLTQSDPLSGADIHVLKVNSFGDQVWQRTFGASGWDEAREVIRTSDGGYLVAAVVSDYASCLIKLNALGDSIWARTYHNPYGMYSWSVVTTADGGYALTGSIGDWSDNSAIFLTKTDSLGDSLWTHTYDSCFYGRALTTTDDGGYVLVGTTKKSHHAHEDLYVIRVDAAGDTVWTRFFGNGDNSFGTGVVQTDDGSFVVAGTICQSRNQEPDACLIKLDATGNTIWTRIFGGDDYDYGQSMVTCSDGGYIVVGGTASFQSDDTWDYDIYLIKTDSLGYSQP